MCIIGQIIYNLPRVNLHKGTNIASIAPLLELIYFKAFIINLYNVTMHGNQRQLVKSTRAGGRLQPESDLTPGLKRTLFYL